MSSSLFQSATVLTKNELLYCSALLSGILKPRKLRISCLVTVLSEFQPLKVVGQILLQFLSAGIRKFSGGMAGMWLKWNVPHAQLWSEAGLSTAQFGHAFGPA